MNISNLYFVRYHIVLGLSSNQLNHFAKLVYIYLLISILEKDFLPYKEIFNSLVEVFQCSERSIYRALKSLYHFGFIKYFNGSSNYIVLNNLSDWEVSK